MVILQREDFDVGACLQELTARSPDAGAVVSFVGLVREITGQESPIRAMTLQHYPGMTEKSISDIIKTAQQKWCLGRVKVIHRIGQLSLGEQIVFVGVTSAHRQDAFVANEFIMDFLKVKAPFWKKEQIIRNGVRSEHWLEAKKTDTDKAELWR